MKKGEPIKIVINCEGEGCNKKDLELAIIVACNCGKYHYFCESCYKEVQKWRNN